MLEPHSRDELGAKNDPTEGGTGKKKNETWQEQAKAQFLKDVSEFTYAVVSHYKGKVKYYELTNEPYFAYTPGQVGDIYKAMSQAAKKADPGCIVGVNTDFRIYTDGKGQYLANRPQYLPETVKLHGLDYTDVITAHFYNNNLGFYVPFGEHLKKYGKPGWNTETGITGASFYKTLPTLESVEEGEAWWPKYLRSQVIVHADIMEKNLLFTISAGQMEKYFYYFSRFGNCSPSQPTKRGGGGKDNVEFDGGLRPGAVAQSVVSHFFEGCQYDSHWTKDPRVDLYLFRDGSGTKGYMYAAGKQPKPLTLTLPKASVQMEFFDLMTNPITPAAGAGGGTELPLTFLVKFFRSPEPPGQVVQALEQMKIEEAKTPAGNAFYGDFESN